MFKFKKNIEDLKDADAVVIGVPFDKGVTFRTGAKKGPSAIANCLDEHLEAYDRFTGTEPFYEYNIDYIELGAVSDTPEEQMIDEVNNVYNATGEKFRVLLGGSHAVSNGAFRYFSNKYNPPDVTILQIDAHPDLRDTPADYKESSNKYDHACVMRRAVELGFNTVQVGLRTISKIDADYIAEKKLKIFEWGHGRRITVQEIIAVSYTHLTLPTKRIV